MAQLPIVRREVRRVSDAEREKTARDTSRAQETAYQNLQNLPEPFGLNGLSGKDSDLAREIEKLLEPDTRRFLLRFFKSELPEKAKGEMAWSVYLPKETSPAEGEAARLALSPRYYWGDFMALPAVRKTLVEDAALGFIDTLTSTADFIDNEERLLKEWQELRPAYFDFAEHSTIEYINKNYSQRDKVDPECKAGLRAVWITRMAAHRFLDAHFTGNQTFRASPCFGGLSSMKRKLHFGFVEDLDEKDAEYVTKQLAYIKIGCAEKAEYGLPKNVGNTNYLERTYGESKLTPGHTSIYNHPVSQVASMLCPLMSMLPEKIKQKDLNSVKFLYGMYQVAKDLQQVEKHSKLPNDLRGVTISPDALPEGVVSRFDPDWMRQHFLSPAWVKFAGFAPYIHQKRLDALNGVLDGMPQFREQLERSDTVEQLVLQRTRKVVVAPIAAKCIQHECYNVFQELFPDEAKQALQRVNEAHKAKPGIPEKSVLERRFALFEATLDFLLDDQYPQRHAQVLEHLVRKWGVQDPKYVSGYVDAPPEAQWVHPSTLSPT